MLIKDVEKLADRAILQYDANSDLRQLDREITDLRHADYRLQIPTSMKERATPIYARIADEKVNRCTALIDDPRGPVFSAARMGQTAKADADRETLQQWIQGGLAVNEDTSERRLHSMWIQDNLQYGRAWGRVLPGIDAYDGMPGEGAGVEVRILADNYDPTQPDEEAIKLARRHSQAVTAAQHRHKCRRFPVKVEWVPAPAVHDLWDSWGLREVYDIQEIKAATVLSDYIDQDGEPLAQKLADAVEEDQLSPNDMVTVVTRADRDHIQVALIGWLIDEGDDNRTSHQVLNVEEIIWEDEHGMGECPYILFSGRETQSRNPRRRYNGILHPVRDLCKAYDNLVTQLMSAVRMVAWPSLVLYKSPEAQGVDRPARIVLEEGNVYGGLAVGDKLENPQWTNAGDFRLLFEAATLLLRLIDTATLTMAAYGAASAESGYQQAQLEAGAQTVLEASTIGLEKGYRRLGRLMFLAGRSLMEIGSGDIPVRFVNDEGTKYVVLTEELAAQDWHIEVSIRSKPAGGEHALATTLAFMEDRGWTDKEYSQERLGIRNPGRIQEGRYLDALRNHPKVLDLLAQSTIDYALSALTEQLAQQPENPVMPAAAIGALQTEGALSRLPGGLRQLGAPAPNAGLPSPNSMAGIPPTPTATQTLNASLGPMQQARGSLAGQGQATPGGLQRQDYLGSLAA